MTSDEREIVILDYGVGNIGNLINCFDKMGHEVELSSDPVRIDTATVLVLPGVGAFEDAMTSLIENDLVNPLKKRASEGKPLIGICLGMQLMFDKSYEHGTHEGLGILRGEIERFDESLRIPHMGWNEVVKATTSPILTGIVNGDYVYFVHSYKLAQFTPEDVLIYSDYGGRFPAAVRKGYIAGFQFHPEKSGPVGIKLLKNYIDFALKSTYREEV